MHPDSQRYPPIASYGLIGDSRASALVSRAGSIDWMCLPNFDSPSVFGRLVDWERGGYFQIVPTIEYEVERAYIDTTNVLRTTFRTADGEASVIDFLPAETEREKRTALEPLRSLFRIVEGATGVVPFRLEYAPRPQYGNGHVSLNSHTPFEVTAARGRHVMHLRSDVALDCSRFDARADFTVAPGQRVRFSMAYSFGEPAVILSDGYVDEIYDRTLAYWRQWSAACTYDGPYRQDVLRSALTLKMLSFAPSGAIVAAPTTSLPERMGADRNWDYRYCWIRDAAFTVHAFVSIGLRAEANAFVGWLMHATHQTAPKLMPLYTLFGEPNAPERTLEHFEGYRGSHPVRIGNAAQGQHQFDVYGELVDAFHRFVKDQGMKVARDEAKFIADIADFVADHWREPDSGIWEPRMGPQHYTHSKIMAWDALQHAAMMAEEGIIHADPARWRSEGEAIRDEVLRRGYNSDIGAFTQVLGGDAVDASLLVMPLVGFIEADDPRMLSTIDAIRARLDRNGFLKRYDAPDGLDGEEGAFLVCNFWLVSALAAAGRLEDAHAVFQRTRAALNDLGLMSEEVDTETCAALGNFPQGLSHLGLIGAALAIDEASPPRLRASSAPTASLGRSARESRRT